MVDGGRERGLRTALPLLELTTEMFVLLVLHLAAPQVVDRTMLCRRHEPGPGIIRDAGLGPLLERGDDRVLRQLFADADATDAARQPGAVSSVVDPLDRFPDSTIHHTRHP